MISDQGHYSLAIVTTELFPYTRGGIGVLNANLIKEFSSAESRILVLNVSDVQISGSDARSLYPHADIVNSWQLLKNHDVLPADAFSRTSEWHFRSYIAKRCLEVLGESGLRFGVIEFQDFGGLASQTLLSRRSIPSAADAEISVRVHGPFGLLRQVHGYPAWMPHLAIADLERTAFSRADAIVFHVPGVVSAVQKAFALPPSMLYRVRIQRPPVGSSNGFEPEAGTPVPRLVFASKVETWKNAADFMKALKIVEALRGPVDAVVAAPLSVDDRDAAQLFRSLTSQRARSLRWVPDANASTRKRLLRSSAVVIPSRFEAFCLLAHEAAITGGRPVLNALNPAFDDESPWVDGLNCWKYDGSVRSLADTMERALDLDLAEPLVWSHDPLPYSQPSTHPTRYGDPAPVARPSALSGSAVPNGPVAVDVIVTNAGLDEYLSDAIESLSAQTLKPSNVIIVNDGGLFQAPLGESVREALGGIPLKVLSTPTPLGLSTARNLGLESSLSDFVVFMDADDVFEPSYLERAVTALQADPSADVFVPYAMPFEHMGEYWVGKRAGAWCFLGEAYFSRYVANWMSTASCVVRRTALPEGPFDEGLDLLEDWDLWSRMQEVGAQFTTDHRIGLWYRQRPDSMMSLARGTVKEGAALDRLRSKAWQSGSAVTIGAALTDVGTPSPVQGSAVVGWGPELQAELARLTSVEREASLILDRRAVRLAITTASALRPWASNRSALAEESVFSKESGK